MWVRLAHRAELYGQLGVKLCLKGKYKAYVGLGVGDEIKQFYGKGSISPYLGSDTFRDWVYQQRQIADDESS